MNTGWNHENDNHTLDKRLDAIAQSLQSIVQETEDGQTIRRIDMVLEYMDRLGLSELHGAYRYDFCFLRCALLWDFKGKMKIMNNDSQRSKESIKRMEDTGWSKRLMAGKQFNPVDFQTEVRNILNWDSRDK